MMIRDPQGTASPPLKMRLANLAWAQSHTHPPSSTHPLLHRRAHAFPSSSPFITTSDRKASSSRPLPSPLPPSPFASFLNSSPLLLPPHALPLHRPSVSPSRLPPNPLLRNPEPARCHSGIFTPSKRHPQPHDLSDQPQRSPPVKPSCEITPIELLSDIPRRHPRSVIILEGPNVTAVLSQLALNLSDLQDIDCRDRFSLLATQRYVRSSRLASAPCKGWARTGSSPVGRVHFMSRDQCLYFFRQ